MHGYTFSVNGVKRRVAIVEVLALHALEPSHDRIGHRGEDDFDRDLGTNCASITAAACRRDDAGAVERERVEERESTPSPRIVEPMVRDQSQRPCVAIFILASTKEFTNSPQKYAIIEASAMRQVAPKAISYASWFFQNGAGGSAHHPRHEGREREAGEPAQITAPAARVAVDLREHVAEHVRDRKEEHAGAEREHADDRPVHLRDLRRPDQVRADQDRDERRHHELVVRYWRGGRLIRVFSRWRTASKRHSDPATPALSGFHAPGIGNARSQRGGGLHGSDKPRPRCPLGRRPAP
jgi:hypothetical protein